MCPMLLSVFTFLQKGVLLVIIDGLNISLRPANEDDKDNMYEWEMESIDPSLREDPKIQDYMHKDVEESVKDTQMIMCDDKTIGMFISVDIDGGEFRYIGEIFLIPEYRGHGIGTYLLKSEMEKYDKIKLQVAYSNTRAIKLYESLGFRIIESKDKYNTHVMLYDKSEHETITEGDENMTNLERLLISEAALTPKQRNALDDSQFGIPETRSYPLNDENHVRMANKLFGMAPKEHKHELAKKILAAAKEFNIDTSKWKKVNEAAGEVIQEAVKIGLKKPVYFIFVSEHKPVMSNMIRDITDTDWTHAGISFDPSLRKIYTFGMRLGENYGGRVRGVGFALESVKDYAERKTEDIVSVVVGFVDKKTYNTMKETVREFKVNAGKTRFDWGVLAKFIARKDKGGAKNKKWVQVCSSFVDYVMNAADLKVTPEGDLVSPESLRQGIFSKDNAVKEVFKGYASDYHEEFVADETEEFAKDKATKGFDDDKVVSEGYADEILNKAEQLKMDKFHMYPMDFLGELLRITPFNKSSMSESIKQAEKPNLEVVMFAGFMDPDNVQRTEGKHLIKHTIYSADNDTIYSSFFNSFTRRNEMSAIASSMDALIGDLKNKCVKELHIPPHMKDCMISLTHKDRTIHSRGNIPMKFTYNEHDGCFMNTYYSYFAAYEAFEFKRNPLYKSISRKLMTMSEFDGDETHFDFEEIDIMQENYATCKIHVRFRYDNEPYIVVVPVVDMETQQCEIYRESARDEKDDVVPDEVTAESFVMEEPVPPVTRQARLIELAFQNKLTGLSIEQEKLVDEYRNVRDQVYAAGEYYKRETKLRKKELKRLQEEYSVAPNAEDREKIKEDIIRITQEINEFTREYSESVNVNIARMNELADEFDELERGKAVQPQPTSLLSKFLNITEI